MAIGCSLVYMNPYHPLSFFLFFSTWLPFLSVTISSTSLCSFLSTSITSVCPHFCPSLPHIPLGAPRQRAAPSQVKQEGARIVQSTVTTGILSPALPGAGQYPKGVSWGQKLGAVSSEAGPRDHGGQQRRTVCTGRWRYSRVTNCPTLPRG